MTKPHQKGHEAEAAKRNRECNGILRHLRIRSASLFLAILAVTPPHPETFEATPCPAKITIVGSLPIRSHLGLAATSTYCLHLNGHHSALALLSQ